MELREKIEKNLEGIRAALRADGGNVELIDITPDGVVKVRLIGACAGCPMSAITLAFGMERELKKNVPEVKRVEAI